MASAAPAAPSPSAPATGGGQPAPGAIPAAPTPATPDTPATPAAAKAPVKAKPIRLPGVFPDDDPFPSPPSSDKAGAARPRDASGRFVPDAPSGTEGAAAAEHTGEPDTPPEAKPKFKFLGEEFDSQEAAEQNVKSLRGQFKPLQQKAAQADQFRAQLGQAAESARAWKAEAERLQAELEGRGGAQPEPATKGDGPDGAEGDVPGVDWELYAEIKRLADEKGEGWRAEQWLHEQNEKIINARLQRALDERFEPVQQHAEKAALAEHTEQLFGNLASYTNADGTPAFPELSDEHAAFEIGRMWASLGLPRQAALTPQGAVAAIAMYRMAKSMSQGKPAATAPAAGIVPEAAAPETPEVPTDTSAAAGLDDGRPSVARPGASVGKGPSAEAAAILQGLRSLRSPRSAKLGFDE